MQHSMFKTGHTCGSNVPIKMLADRHHAWSVAKTDACNYITCCTAYIAQLANQQCDGYLSGSSLKWVPLLVLGNVWVLVVRVMWFVSICFSPLCFGFTPSYDLSYASIPHLEGLQQISELLHPKLTAPPEAAIKTIVKRLAYKFQGGAGCVLHLAVLAGSPKELHVIVRRM